MDLLPKDNQRFWGMASWNQQHFSESQTQDERYHAMSEKRSHQQYVYENEIEQKKEEKKKRKYGKMDERTEGTV